MYGFQDAYSKENDWIFNDKTKTIVKHSIISRNKGYKIIMVGKKI